MSAKIQKYLWFTRGVGGVDEARWLYVDNCWNWDMST